MKVPDGPLTSGRDKTKWKLPNGNVVTHKKHPYDVGAPNFHTDEHYHVDGPGYSHPRFSPGDTISPIFWKKLYNKNIMRYGVFKFFI